MYPGMLPRLVFDGLKLCKFVSPSDLVLISFWMLTMPWIVDPISFYRRASRFAAFQTKVARLCFCLALRTPRPATGVLRALRARSVPGSVPENGGCPTEYPQGCFRDPSGHGLRSVQKVSREFPWSVQKLSRTLRGHSQDTFWTLRSPWPEGSWRHPVGHSVGHPSFSGTLLGNSPGHFRPEGPEGLL